ncbi:hypothetical protein VNO80_18377 [Phaseolus coccineus]|uniref:Uncharacterized protein n=1 Tax=Phaseolus coccineus TaxID=3886 RepID=A0AAN9MF92_PHACN
MADSTRRSCCNERFGGPRLLSFRIAAHGIVGVSRGYSGSTFQRVAPFLFFFLRYEISKKWFSSFLWMCVCNVLW